MDNQIQGMVEGRNGYDHAKRFVNGEGPAVDARWGNSHGDFPSARGAQHFGSIAHAVDRTANLHDRVCKWLAALAGDLAAEMFALALYEGSLEYLDPLVRLQPAVAIAKIWAAVSSLRSSATSSSSATSAKGIRSNAWTTLIIVSFPFILP